MRKIILICLSLIAFTSVSLHSQWIEKEGYWELSEKVPDLRDLKILPEENLIITVSKDNTIRHIEYDSGKILKSGKPSDITEDNDYAKISSDGKTTVVARYKEGKNFTDINISVLNNSNYMIIAEDNFQNGIKYDKSQVREVTEMKINHLDYGYLTNALILANYIKTQGSENGGQYKTWGQKGNIYFAKTVGNNFNLIKHFENDAPLAIKRISNKSDGNYISILYDHFKYENARRTSIEENNSLVIFDSNFDTTQLFKSKYSYLRTDSYPDGAWSLTETGYLFPMYQLFETENPNLLKIRSNGKLFTFDIDKGELIDSLENHIYKKDIISFNQARLIGQIDNKNFNIYNAVNTKLISTTTLPQKVTIANPMINEKNNRTFFVLESGEVVFYKLDVLEQFPKEIITLSKDVAYVGETIEFTSLDNSINADYKWEIDNEVIMITKDRNFHYKFDKAGVYDIKLTITLPNSSTHEFTKLKAIRVNDSLKADFEIMIQNSELPLRVNFGDKSKGNIKKMFWDFGDGQTVDGFNPEHTYRFKGDFSPMLIISDDNYSDTIIKYELIKTHTEIIDDGVPDKTNRINSKQNALRNAFLMEKGINVNWSYEYNKPRGYQDYYDYFSEVTALLYDFNLNENHIDSTKISHWNPQYSKYFFTERLSKIDNNRITVLFSRDDIDLVNYDFSSRLKSTIKPSLFSYRESVHGNPDKTIFWVINQKDNANVVKTDYDFKILSELSIPPNDKQYLADTLDNGLNLIVKEQNNAYSYFSISAENTLNYEKSFSLDTNITLTNIKSVHENLILLHGYYNDIANKTTYAYFAKYHPLDNTLKDTILYSRKDIWKLERVNNSTFAAIGQSRGRQGYLLLDTNLNQIRDIRVDSLTGEIKDMIIYDNKVYLFTEKIVSLSTMALGAKESYQTTASVLSLPEDIIASVDESLKIFTERLIHSAYPNPTSETLNLRVATNESANFTIKLYDIFGSEITRIHDGFIPENTEKIFSIPTSDFPTGAYYYVISGRDMVERGKVMVVR